jgi:hypothetical protein
MGGAVVKAWDALEDFAAPITVVRSSKASEVFWLARWLSNIAAALARSFVIRPSL